MKKLIVIIGLLICGITSKAQSANLTYSATLQWSYPVTNFTFKVYGALGVTNFTVLDIVTNKLSSFSNNLPANVTNQFYVTAVDPKTGLESIPGNIVTHKFVITNPAPVTNLVITSIILN
jgi:hypothetical protein